MQKIRTYADPEAPEVTVRIKDQWISDSSYRETVQKMIIPCTDVILTRAGDQALFLGKRSTYPMKGIWCLGGRIFFNDLTPEDSIARCLNLETGVSIPAKRFEYLCTNFYSWTKVAQGDFFGKNMAATYHCVVTDEELHTMACGLVAAEYDKEFGLQRFDRARLVDERVHQAMLDIFDQLFPS